jgi:DNA-binding MurR/RpiR family transcriptional regulator
MQATVHRVQNHLPQWLPMLHKKLAHAHQLIIHAVRRGLLVLQDGHCALQLLGKRTCAKHTGYLIGTASATHAHTVDIALSGKGHQLSTDS